MSEPFYAHTGARLWSTTMKVVDGHWHYKDALTGELIGTCPVDTDEQVVREPHEGKYLGLIQSNRSKPVTHKHAMTAIEYLLLFSNEEDHTISSCAITLMNYIHHLEQQLEVAR